MASSLNSTKPTSSGVPGPTTDPSVVTVTVRNARINSTSSIGGGVPNLGSVEFGGGGGTSNSAPGSRPDSSASTHHITSCSSSKSSNKLNSNGVTSAGR